MSKRREKPNNKMLTIAAILFDNFETLDVFGPIEVLGRFPEKLKPEFYSMNGGIITSAQKAPVVTNSFAQIAPNNYALLIPGGIGTRDLVNDRDFIGSLSRLAGNAAYILTVCTGSVLFSKTGLLNGKRATSNKRAFSWALKESPKVNWVKKSRWVKDGNIYSSSGVSAGIDLAFGFISDLLGHNVAMKESTVIEYDWKDDPGWDPFAELY